jgi:RNA polymerase sigma-70 factor (ECF subfamily)
MTDHTDAHLLRAAEPAAFAELYRRHAPSIHRWLDRRVPWAAADLTAETFAQAWLWGGRFGDDRDGSAFPWLLGIAANVLRESARRDRVETRARERLGLPLDLADDLDAVDDRLSPRPGLREAVSALPRHERDAVALRVLADLPFPEVARRLDIRPAAARRRVSRALRRLALQTPKEEL